MLFLRDIDGDVRIRCLSCGHEGRLLRADLVRRFGPGYPVLSLAPHFRCSRCHSRDTESRPFAAAAPPQPAAEPPATPAAVPWTADTLLNSLLESLDEPDVPAPAAAEDEDEDEAEEIAGEDEPRDLPFARPAAAEPEGEEEDEKEEEGEEGAEEDIAVDRTLAALRAFIGDGIGDGVGPGDVEPSEEPAAGTGAVAAEGPAAEDGGFPPDADTPEAFFRGLGRQDEGGAAPEESTAAAEAGEPVEGEPEAEEVEEVTDEEILDFAIRDREAPPAADEENEEPPLDLVDVVPEGEDDPARPDLFAETLANLRDLVGDDGKDERRDEPAPGRPEEAEEVRPAPVRAAPLSMAASLAALRELVEKAAQEDEPPARPRRPPPPKPRPPERPFSETLAALRGMLDLDRDEEPKR
ncbi:hypothetical protein [Azospirillum sp. ST 5-10]|uniref:hypothetical protein n=1 Tax=unclassified Azospirillum TaxID=2630922 RepID=UPI003F4A29C2